jgi:hypothetical protein
MPAARSIPPPICGGHVLLNVMATIALWRDSARKPEKLKRKFTAALLHGEPITPRHQPPLAIGERFNSLVGATNGTMRHCGTCYPGATRNDKSGIKGGCGQQKIA